MEVKWEGGTRSYQLVAGVKISASMILIVETGYQVTYLVCRCLLCIQIKFLRFDWALSHVFIQAYTNQQHLKKYSSYGHGQI